jgi:hypothetical protein
MNDYPHKVDLRGTLTDLDQMYTDLTRVKTSPLIGLLASTVVGAVAASKEDILAQVGGDEKTGASELAVFFLSSVLPHPWGTLSLFY